MNMFSRWALIQIKFQGHKVGAYWGKGAYWVEYGTYNYICFQT